MVDLSEKVALFGNGLVSEVIRQWLELLLGTGLLVWFFYSAYKLAKTLKAWLVLDIVLIIVLMVRILLFLVFEFLYPSRFLPYVADLLYMGVVVLVFYLFAGVVLPEQMHKIFNKTTYVAVMLFLLVCNLIYAIIDFQSAFF